MQTPFKSNDASHVIFREMRSRDEQVRQSDLTVKQMDILHTYCVSLCERCSLGAFLSSTCEHPKLLRSDSKSMDYLNTNIRCAYHRSSLNKIEHKTSVFFLYSEGNTDGFYIFNFIYIQDFSPSANAWVNAQTVDFSKREPRPQWPLNVRQTCLDLHTRRVIDIFFLITDGIEWLMTKVNIHH